MKGEFESKKGLEIELKSSLTKAEATLSAASSLLAKLSGEKNRWETQVRSTPAVLAGVHSQNSTAASSAAGYTVQMNSLIIKLFMCLSTLQGCGSA